MGTTLRPKCMLCRYMDRDISSRSPHRDFVGHDPQNFSPGLNGLKQPKVTAPKP